MKVGISTGFFYENDLIGCLPIIKEAGFDTIEIWAGPHKWAGDFRHFNWHNDGYNKNLKKALSDLGMKVFSLHAPYSDEIDISETDESKRVFSVGNVIKSIDVMKYLNGEVVILHPSLKEVNFIDKEEKNNRVSQIKKSVLEIYAHTKEVGVKLAVENLLPHIIGGQPDVLFSIINGYTNGDIGFCFDTSHANLIKGTDLCSVFKLFSKRVIAFHLSDNKGERDDHLIFGKGNIDWLSFIKQIRESDYNSTFILEMHGEAKTEDKLGSLKNIHEKSKELLRGEKL